MLMFRAGSSARSRPRGGWAAGAAVRAESCANAGDATASASDARTTRESITTSEEARVGSQDGRWSRVVEEAGVRDLLLPYWERCTLPHAGDRQAYAQRILGATPQERGSEDAAAGLVRPGVSG